MKKIFSILAIFIVALTLTGCTESNNDNNAEIPFQVSVVNINASGYLDTRYVLFTFTYTQEMFDYEIQKTHLTDRAGHILLRCRINGGELVSCGNVNNMFGIKYTGYGTDVTLAHKPNEQVYFYRELNVGQCNIDFYLEYAADSPYVLIDKCSLSFEVI